MNPWLPFEWIVAWRFLREGRMQTLFIVAGITVGVAVIIFMSALLTGLQANIIHRVLTAQSHIQLLPPKEVARVLGPADRPVAGVRQLARVQAPLQRLKSIDQWQSLMAQLRAMPEVALVSPVAGGSALAVRGDASRAISIVGVVPDLYFQVVDVPSKVVAGTTRLTNADMLIGIDLASDLGVGVGDKLQVTAASGGDNTLTVTGLFDLGNKGANQRTAYVALRTAQALLGLIGGVSSIDVNVRDIYAAEAVVDAVAQVADHMPAHLEGQHDAILLRRVDAAKQRGAAHPRAQCRFVRTGDLLARENALDWNLEQRAEVEGDEFAVAAHDLHGHATARERMQRLGRAGLGRIDEGGEAREHQIAFVPDVGMRVIAAHRARGDGQHAQSLAFQ
ncbi:ABC transporter permease [Variovorax brevis]|uniref:ABC transporter permease n=1 Tax=Variovorax brevis TaxID=3053503 RepID=UPI003365542E